MQMTDWIARHPIAAQELFQLLQTAPPPPADTNPTSEEAVQAKVRLDSAHVGWALWRNNVGVLQDQRGVPVRFGLANDSPQMNRKVKSSDLIGIKPVTVTQEMVGTVIGQFVAREVKHADWAFKGTEHEVAQAAYLAIVNRLGGDGKFTTGGLG